MAAPIFVVLLAAPVTEVPSTSPDALAWLAAPVGPFTDGVAVADVGVGGVGTEPPTGAAPLPCPAAAGMVLGEAVAACDVAVVDVLATLGFEYVSLWAWKMFKIAFS